MEDLGPSVYDEYDGSVSGNEMEETSSTTLGDVFVIPALPAGSAHTGHGRRIPANPTRRDPVPCIDGSYQTSEQNYDTGLGVRVKSTGDWVATDDDNNGGLGATVYGGQLNESRRKALPLASVSVRSWSVPLVTISR